jgi:hypothetical protein
MPTFRLMFCLSDYRPRILSITTLALLLLTPVVHAQAQTWGLKNVYIFQGGIGGPDGGTPYTGLILGSDGNYYGTTWYGGTGGGTVFKVTPTGTESLVYAFSGSQDGQLPFKLIQGADGNLYGATLWGGGTTTIALHKSTELKWSSTDAQSCQASSSWNGSEPVKGKQSETPAGTGPFAYTLTCTGIGGSASASAMVNVTQ